jgi:hypothetical protein
MMAAGLVAMPLLPAVTYADDSTATCTSPTDCIQKGSDSTTKDGSGGGTDLKTFIKTIVNILLFVLGAIAVIMIIIGGIRYTTSNGDASAVKGAKDTIFYAVIGLVVAILAYAIVNFVISSLVKS